MLVPDYHLHTEFSGDCHTNIKDLLDTALANGFSTLCITDHNDFEYPEVPDMCDFNLDMDAYLPRLKELKEEYKEKGFDLRIGVEQGVMPSTAERLNSFSKEHEGLDFIICSTHFVDGYDPYYPQYFEGKDSHTAYQRYFDVMLESLSKFTDYNVLGHIDYIFRYGKGLRKIEDFHLAEYEEVIREILSNVIQNGKGIEINTGALYRGMEFAHPHPDILKLYKELGGEIITLGSDSHDLEHIGYGFDQGIKLAKSCGFTHYCQFKDRKPEFIPLP